MKGLNAIEHNKNYSEQNMFLTPSTLFSRKV